MPLRVRVLRDLRQDLLRERVVDLDLWKAVLVVPVHGMLGFLEVLDHKAAARCIRALAFDESRGRHARHQQRSRLLLLYQLEQRDVVITHVAHRGDARADVQPAIPEAHVRVHVEQPREQHAVCSVDGAAGFPRRRARRAHLDDPAILDEHVARGPERARARCRTRARCGSASCPAANARAAC